MVCAPKKQNYKGAGQNWLKWESQMGKCVSSQIDGHWI